MRLSFVLGRIALRTGVAIWRHRLAFIFAALLVAAFGAYEFTFAGPSVTNGDCADTAMTAVTQPDESAARAAYACLGPAMRNTTEEQFVAGMKARDVPRGHFNRVAEQRTSDGGEIVFYTVQSQGPAIGYIVYLNAQGLVIKVE
jgi:hypothetical protein